MPNRSSVHRPSYIKPRDVQRREYDRQHNPEKSRVYNHEWRALRKAFIQSNPLCADCLSMGKIVGASEVHHVVAVRKAPERRLDPSNLCSLCTTCHSRRTLRGE
jgi:5-methylcytosine-specific restriction protein A